jgi:hypothetical protein
MGSFFLWALDISGTRDILRTLVEPSGAEAPETVEASLSPG